MPLCSSRCDTNIKTTSVCHRLTCEKQYSLVRLDCENILSLTQAGIFNWFSALINTQRTVQVHSENLKVFNS